jgi:two-component system NtrC family response regulator
VRELEHVIERAVILCEGDRVCLEDLPYQFHGMDPWQDEEETVDLEQFLNRTKKYYITRVLQDCEGNKAEAARRLKVNRSYLFQLIKQLEI